MNECLKMTFSLKVNIVTLFLLQIFCQLAWQIFT